ncbi:hypothetical protein GCM10023185_22190 [Hymenobacter saemangeumensis]|uniref:Ankyrin repeat domain-containing protein n=2 Tax=Hymenobacter saemangeumensis TaxID=1084522 RepID=A0ABP8IEZ3_9BACT
MKPRRYYFMLLLILLANTCLAQRQRLGHDVHLFDGPALRLAQAVQQESREAIQKLVKARPGLLNYQEPTYGMTLLYCAVRNSKGGSVEELLELGANPNILETYSGESALIRAATNFETSAYVHLLLAHGANPNLTAKDTPGKTQYHSPLMAAAASRLESVQLLLAAGADLNYTSPGGDTAVMLALMSQRVDIAGFLILEKHADISKPLMRTFKGRNLMAVDFLRDWTFDLDSENYRKKMLLAAYLKAQGQDYWQAPIPKHLQKLYPKGYLEKY